MRGTTRCLLLTVLLSLTSCATPPKPQVSLAPAATAERPLEEKMVWQSHERRPEWTIKEPFEEGGNLLFVGASGKFAEEKEARDDASRHAVSNVVKYFGTDVKDKIEKVWTAYGLSSEVLDPTVAMRQSEEQISKGLARKVKPKEWYIERWERRYKKYTETYHLIWALCLVPKVEVERTIAEQTEYQDKVGQSAKSANDKLTQANNLSIDTERIMHSQPVQAVERFDEVIKLAEQVKVDIVQFPEIAGIGQRAETLVSYVKAKQKEILANPEAVFKASVIGLVAKYPAKPVTVTVTKINYQDTELSSKFSEYFVGKLEEKLAGEPSIYKVLSQSVFQKELKNSHISVDDCLAGKFGKEGVLTTLKGLLSVRYWEKEKNVETEIKLEEVGSRTIVGSTRVNLPKESIPQDVNLKPDETALMGWQVFGTPTSAEGDFKVKVWPDKGEGAVYKEGEEVTFHFRANRDCYVYLYHTDSEGNVKLLFPNSYNTDNLVKADMTYSIPSEKMNFAFRTTPPFGSEIVKAYASLQPISGIQHQVSGITSGEVFRDLGKVNSENVRGIARAIEIVPKESRAESITTITTLQK